MLAEMKQSSEKNIVLKTVLIACPSAAAILMLYVILLLMTSMHENVKWISLCN